MKGTVRSAVVGPFVFATALMACGGERAENVGDVAVALHENSCDDSNEVHPAIETLHLSLSDGAAFDEAAAVTREELNNLCTDPDTAIPVFAEVPAGSDYTATAWAENVHDIRVSEVVVLENVEIAAAQATILPILLEPRDDVGFTGDVDVHIEIADDERWDDLADLTEEPDAD